MQTYVKLTTKRHLSVHTPMNVTVVELAECLGSINEKEYRFLNVTRGTEGLVFEFVHKDNDE